MLYSSIFRPLLFRLDPEKAHNLVIGGLERADQIPGLVRVLQKCYGLKPIPELSVRLCGLEFPLPIGLAAGLDKNGQAVIALSAMGFGFMEIGTVTPKPQPGNDKPRLFRLPEDQALINRMGFNNEGAVRMAERLETIKHRPIPLGINIGKNKTTPNEKAYEDYRSCLERLYAYGDFFVINVSSPNTPDLRNLQQGKELEQLLASVMEERKAQTRKTGKEKPIFVKIAPDLNEIELEYIMAAAIKSGISGIIATNTTIRREGLRDPNACQAGGLSGKPLTGISTKTIRSLYRISQGKIPIIGCGGIFSGEDAYEKIRAGASLVEVYTAFIYQGPGIVRKIALELSELIRRDGFRHISEAVGADCR